MSNLGGWLSLEGMNPIAITNFISVARLFNGTSTYVNGEIKDVTTYNTPTGSWVDSPMSLTSEPTVSAVNVSLFANEAYRATAMNMQTKMANLSASVPIPMRNLIYMYGNTNDDNLLYQMNIPMDFGAVTINSLQLSVLENSAGSGNEHGKIQVIDFGSLSLSGSNWVLQLMFRGYFGPLNLGVRLETSALASSIHDFKTMILNATSN